MGDPPELEILPDGDRLPTIVIDSSAHGRGRIAVLKVFGDVKRGIEALEGAPKIGPWPVVCVQKCNEKYEFVGPDDFPLETLYCKCGDNECVVVEWK